MSSSFGGRCVGVVRRFLVFVLGLGLVAGPLVVLEPAVVSVADTGGSVAAPVIVRQPSGGVFSLSAELMMQVQADSVDGGYLTYAWYRSVLFASALPVTNGFLTDAQVAQVKAAGTATLVGSHGTLSSTTPGTAGYYYYWVDITNNNDVNGDGVIGAGETAMLESALVAVRVMDRSMEPKLMNGDFQTIGSSNDIITNNGHYGYLALGTPALSRPSGEVSLPYWDSTHDNGSTKGKYAEVQRAGVSGVSGTTLDTAGHAATADSVILYSWAQTAPLIAELSAQQKSSIYQDIATVPGKIYEWSLDFAAPVNSAVTEMIAVIIGPAINEEADYKSGITTRWVGPADYTVDSPIVVSGAYSWQYPYGKNLNTYFQDILDAGNVSSDAFANTTAGTSWREAHNGDTFTVPYNGSTYYVQLVSDVGNNGDWTHAPGTYTVPRAQGTTVFGFVSVFAYSSSAGNLLDNIVFASGGQPVAADSISYAGQAKLSATTRPGYVYGLTEVRASTVLNLSGLSATFGASGVSPDGSVGTGGWFNPDAAGTLTFTGLDPGKTYRVVGVPLSSVSAGLGTNLSPADVLDSGYWADTIMFPTGVGDAVTLPNVTSTKTGTSTASAWVANTRSDTQYALLADSGGMPVVSGAGVPVKPWTVGTNGPLVFDGLALDTTYHLVARPRSYVEVTYAAAAVNTDGTTAGISFETPVSSAVDVTPPDLTRSADSTSITVASRLGYTYQVVNPVTGAFVGSAQTGDGSLKMFTGLDAGTVYQVVTQLTSDGVWMVGVRVYPSPDALQVSFEFESVSDSGLQAGVVPATVEYGIKTGSTPDWLVGDGDDVWVLGTGTSAISLAGQATSRSTSILDSIATGGDATLLYREVVSDGYTGPLLQPTRELPIPARPAAPVAGVDYVVDYPDETFNAGAGALQFSPSGTAVWIDIAGSATPSLGSLGWSGSAFGFNVRLKYTSSAFTSLSASGTIAARPPAPALTVSMGAGTLVVGGFTVGVNYQVRQGSGAWSSFVGASGSVTWPFDPGTSEDYQVRLQATATAPASYVRVVSAPLMFDALDFPSVPYGSPIAALTVGIENTTTSAVTLDSLELVGGDAAKFTLSSGSLQVPTTGNTSFTVAPVIPAGGLDVGSYQTMLVASYQVNGTTKTTQVGVTLTVMRVNWDLSSLDLSVDGVSPSGFTLNVAGAPTSSTVVFRQGGGGIVD